MFHDRFYAQYWETRQNRFYKCLICGRKFDRTLENR